MASMCRRSCRRSRCCSTGMSRADCMALHRHGLSSKSLLRAAQLLHPGSWIRSFAWTHKRCGIAEFPLLSSAQSVHDLDMQGLVVKCLHGRFPVNGQVCPAAPAHVQGYSGHRCWRGHIPGRYGRATARMLMFFPHPATADEQCLAQLSESCLRQLLYVYLQHRPVGQRNCCR